MSGRFVPRPVRPVGVIEVSGWRLKQYEVTVEGVPISTEITTAVKGVLVDELPQAAAGGFDVGFVITHHGTDAVWILADLWNDEIISQHIFFAQLPNTTKFSRVPVGGPTACVWELPVHAHERDAYISHVLDPEHGPNIDAYLADVLTLTTTDRAAAISA